jgi:proline iminopeptidase
MSVTSLEVNGARLFVDDRGEASAPALLYIHGGPGLGCYDFMQCQGDALSRTLRVMGVDQRGVPRSDALPPGAALTVEALIDDFEQLRIQLGISRWAHPRPLCGWRIRDRLCHPTPRLAHGCAL